MVCEHTLGPPESHTHSTQSTSLHTLASHTHFHLFITHRTSQTRSHNHTHKHTHAHMMRVCTSLDDCVCIAFWVWDFWIFILALMVVACHSGDNASTHLARRPPSIPPLRGLTSTNARASSFLYRCPPSAHKKLLQAHIHHTSDTLRSGGVAQHHVLRDVAIAMYILYMYTPVDLMSKFMN